MISGPSPFPGFPSPHGPHGPHWQVGPGYFQRVPLPALWGSGCAGAPGIGTKAVGICEGFDFSMAWYGTKFEYVYLC